MNTIEPRNIFLVIFWSYGLYILMNVYQYLGVVIAAKSSHQKFEAIISGNYSTPKTDFLISSTAIIIGIPLIFLITRFLWGRDFEWLRLKFQFSPLVAGLVLGLILPLIILLLLRLFGIVKISWKTVSQPDQMLIILSYLFGAIFTGIAEEIVFRGMAAREIAVSQGWLIATIISGVYFGAAHLLGNLKGLTFLNAMWIILASLIANTLFVALYVRSQSLWLPIGFHIAWNFCLKGLLGIVLSGSESKSGLLQIEFTRSSFLTGGSFGIEASPVTALVYILVIFLILKFPFNESIHILSNK